MGANCKGRCGHLKAVLDPFLWKNRIGFYGQGFKRCGACHKFLPKEYQLQCPCCHTRLISRPKDPANKKLLAQKKALAKELLDIKVVIK